MRSATAVNIGVRAAALLACVCAGPAIASPIGPPPSAASSPAPSGVVTYPSRDALLAHVDDLRALGLTVQPLRRLPMALVAGSRPQLAGVPASGGGARFWAEEALEPHSATSNRATGVDRVHAQGLTGKGVTIAVIDTGIDATLPQLTDHVTHNVLMLGTGLVNPLTPVDPPELLLTPVDLGPGSITDADGHGTEVAGVAAADGTGDANLVGVAPDAEVIGYAAGQTLGMSMVLASMDHILDHPEWGIDVVNNSYGTPKFDVFDPAAPFNVASRALHDAGITVVFSAGNAGAAGPMSMGQRSLAPWVISVGGIDARGDAWSRSSQGLELDNAVAAPVVDGHVSATGDRLGLYHPSVLAPATDMEFPCPTVNISACTPPGKGSGPYFEGTSFAAPQVAGIVALLGQARPDLTPGEARRVLEATAVPTADEAPVWRAGFGVVDAAAAVELVRRPGFRSSLDGLHRAAEARLLADRPWRVERSDLWTSPTPVVTAGGAVPLPVHDLIVPPGTDALTVGLATYEPSGTAAALEGYAVVVRDAGGSIVGRTRQHGATAAGPVSSVVLHLRGTSPAFGRWTLSVEGIIGVNDEPEAPYSGLVVHAALLEAK